MHSSVLREFSAVRYANERMMHSHPKHKETKKLLEETIDDGLIIHLPRKVGAEETHVSWPNKVKQRGESNPLPLHPTGNHIVVLLKHYSAGSWYYISNIVI